MMCLLTFQKKHIVWKSLKISHLILAFSFNICPIKIDLYINTVWLQALRFSKTRQIDYFDISNKHSKYEHIAHLAGNVEWDFFCDFQTSREMEIFPPIFLSCQRRVRVCVSQECCCCCISAALGALHLLVLQFFSFFFSSDGALEPPTTSSLLVDGEKVSAANTHTLTFSYRYCQSWAQKGRKARSKWVRISQLLLVIIEKENLKCERGENLILLPFKNLVKVCWHSILVISRKNSKLSNHIVLILLSNQSDFAEKNC